MAKTDHDSWSGIFRVWTVLCLILLVLAQSAQDLVSSGSGTWQVLHIYEGLTRWAVPAMFMAWGMTSLGTGKATLKSHLLMQVLPCFGLLVFWGALYAVAAHLLQGGALSLAGLFSALKAAAMGETYFHLWILYPLLGLYLAAPVLNRFVSSATRGEVLYFLALCFLFAGVLPVWSAFQPNHFVVQLLERLRLHLVLGWVGFYVAGWYLRKYTISRLSEYVIYALGILGMVLTLMGDKLLGGSWSLWYSYTAPGVAMTAVAMCVLFRYVLGISDERSRRSTVRSFGSCAFGIYLFHQIWALLLRWFGFSLLDFTPVLSIPVFALVFFLLSIPFAWLISLIPGVGKWIL